MKRAPRGRLAPRWSALPRLLGGAPPLALLIVGGLALLLGLLIVTRPLTSLVVLTIYVGLSAIASGIAELTGRQAGWLRRLLAAVWALAGLAILIGLGRSLELLPDVLAYLLMLGGLASFFDAFVVRGVSRRVLAAVWGGAQIAFGVLALTWPDVSILVVAIVFGVRTVLFGVTTIVRAIRGLRQSREDAPDAEPSRRVKAWATAGRYALCAVLVTSAVGGWWANEWLLERATVVDAFYDPPDVVPYEHGRLIRSDDFQGQYPPDASVTRILYTTRDALGQPAVASALVIVPDERPPGARPVIAWNHGTTGVARGCAPSLRDASATRWAIPALNDALDRGWIVVASDYSGQGAPGVFPYLIGRGEARSSLDAVLAARELDGPVLSRRTVAWGHSQGGHAALWMSQIAPDYAPDVLIQGTAVLAPVSDPLALAEELPRGGDDALLSILTSWVLVPYADTYDDVDLGRYVAPGAEAIVREMTQRCPSDPGVIVSVATALGVSEDRPLYVGDLTTGPLGARLDENAARGPWGTPTLLTWGDEDEVIPPHLQEEFFERMCADGENVRRLVYRGYDHLGTLLPGSSFLPVLISWTETVLSPSREPHDDCAS